MPWERLADSPNTTPWPACGTGRKNPEPVMPTHIAPFAGVRYSSRVVPDLGTIMTPPYDVISNAERVAYMVQSPYSMIHLILGAEHADDTADNNRFTRAAALLREWRRTGVLMQERQPALYIYQQEFRRDGV